MIERLFVVVVVVVAAVDVVENYVFEQPRGSY